MNDQPRQTWQSVRDEVLRRIHARDWAPGALIPNEADLAQDFGCARATVNRALRAVAERGLLDRRRKAGTRVALHPTTKATLTIPVIRSEVETLGCRYGYALLDRSVGQAPRAVTNAIKVAHDSTLLHLKALHRADEHGYALEDRWINLATVPDAATADFASLSANEWLLATTPYTHGDLTVSASAAADREARVLGCEAGTALLVMDRLTWDGARSVTKVRLIYRAGHRLQTRI